MDDQKDLNSYQQYDLGEEQRPNDQEQAKASEQPVIEEVYHETIREGLMPEKEGINWLREVYEWSQSVAVAVVLALIINQFVFAMVQVEGGSMLPTLETKERLVITKLFYQPKAKDIVVVKSHALGKHIVKRIIAMPGDELELRSETGEVLVNGEVIEEPYIKEKMRSAGTAFQYPITVPEGYVFVMGDNRNNSQDSRNLGLIAREDIVGCAVLRISPFSKFGTLYKNLEK